MRTAAFYFMEMNTRIQVEHPVTEMVTSFDLVKEQIRVAAGEPLIVQGRRPSTCAATPSSAASTPRIPTGTSSRARGSSPRTIRPAGPGVRVDTHVYAGYTVPPHYDSLLAKVIVHGNDRQEALQPHGPGARQLHPRGRRPPRSRSWPASSAHPDFVAGEVDTQFLEREPQLLKPE